MTIRFRPGSGAQHRAVPRRRASRLVHLGQWRPRFCRSDDAARFPRLCRRRCDRGRGACRGLCRCDQRRRHGRRSGQAGDRSPQARKTARFFMPPPASPPAICKGCSKPRVSACGARRFMRPSRSERLSDATRQAIARHEIDAALFFSPRNAATFVRLAAGLEEGCQHMVAVALSSAVAEKLAPLPWRRVAVAAAPNESALLAALDSSMASS